MVDIKKTNQKSSELVICGHIIPHRLMCSVEAFLQAIQPLRVLISPRNGYDHAA